MKVYVVFMCSIGRGRDADDSDSLITYGSPEFFTLRDEAIYHALDRSRGLTTRFAGVWEYSSATGAKFIGSGGWRPATYGMEFPGSAEYCRARNKDIAELARGYEAEVLVKEGS